MILSVEGNVFAWDVSGIPDGKPALVLHGGRHPVATAFDLARVWPGAELMVRDDSGHPGSDPKRGALLRALDRFAL